MLQTEVATMAENRNSSWKKFYSFEDIFAEFEPSYGMSMCCNKLLDLFIWLGFCSNSFTGLFIVFFISVGIFQKFLRMHDSCKKEKVKADVALPRGIPTSEAELQDVTCHVGSHSVTCIPATLHKWTYPA